MHRGHGFGYRGYHDGAWFWVARAGFMFALLALIAVAIAYFLRANRRPVTADSASPTAAPALSRPSESRRDDAAIAHLRLRYAKGDISRDEFLVAARDLGAAVDSVAAPTPSDLNPPPAP